MLPMKVISIYLTAACLLVFVPVVTRGQMRFADDEFAAPSQMAVASPCPAAFTYDPRVPGANTWTGVIQLTTDYKLVGFNLDIKLNKPVDLLGNWQGMVETEDNTRFSITSTTKKISPGPGLALRIFVKYSSSTAPHIIWIKLNGRNICPGPGGAKISRTTTSPTTQRVSPRTVTFGSTTVASNVQFRFSNDPTLTREAPNEAGIHRPVVSDNIYASNGKRNSAGSGNEECGKVHPQPQGLITLGQGTQRGQWPWHVALYQNKGKDLSYSCGGTLIGRKTVVTAAHCVTTKPSDRAVDPDSLVLYFGKYLLTLWSDGGVQNKQVQQVVVHPLYNSSAYKNDLAVLTLQSPVEYTDFVRPVCLWDSSKTSLREVEDQEGSVVGWGFDETGKVSSELMLVKMPVVSQVTCISSYPSFFAHFLTNTSYCAGYRNGTSVCNGDSGGGMHFPIRQRDGTHTWFLRGLVSISVAKQNERVCDTNHYAVFTDLAQYLPWLTSFIK